MQDMQFFGARCNLPKLLLYIMNGGKDEVTGDQVGPAFPALTSGDGPLKYDEIVGRLDEGMAWLAKLYCNTMNVIHYMHDKYDYERVQVCPSAWSVVADSFGATVFLKGVIAAVCSSLPPASLVKMWPQRWCGSLVSPSWQNAAKTLVWQLVTVFRVKPWALN